MKNVFYKNLQNTQENYYVVVSFLTNSDSIGNSMFSCELAKFL